ncbi:MAG: hypothetical protein ACKVP3_23060 [Hyphomicrobiaceae bacterium]
MLAFAAVIWGLRSGINHMVDSVASLFGRGVKAKVIGENGPAVVGPAHTSSAHAPAARFRPSRSSLLASAGVIAAIAIASGGYAIVVQLWSGEKQAVIDVAEALACTEPERLQWSQQIRRSGDKEAYETLLIRANKHNCKILYKGKEIYVLDARWWSGMSKVRAMGTLDEVWIDTAELKWQ